MTSQSQRIKGAVLSAPYLLDEIVQSQGFSMRIFNSTVKRLLPYRSSVEIEHGPVLKSQKIKDIIKECNKIDPRIFHNDLMSYHPEKIGETKFSIINWKCLPLFYKLLNQYIQEGNYKDKDGSIHIHIDISNWLNIKNLNHSQQIDRIIGYTLISYSKKVEICKFLNSILDETGLIFNFPIEKIDNKLGWMHGHEEGNRRTIRTSKPTETFEGDKFNLSKRLEERSNFEFREVSDKRHNEGLPEPEGKLNWINIRARETNSIEYRVGECSFDYQTIVSQMIALNHLTKKFLNYIDYIGKRFTTHYNLRKSLNHFKNQHFVLSKDRIDREIW